MLFRSFTLHIDDTKLRAEAWGESVNAGRHHPVVEVKGATYTALDASRTTVRNGLRRPSVDV